MAEDSKNYIVTEVGCFGSMDEFKDADPTMEEVNPKKKKKSMEELMEECIESNRNIEL